MDLSAAGNQWGSRVGVKERHWMMDMDWNWVMSCQWADSTDWTCYGNYWCGHDWLHIDCHRIITDAVDQNLWIFVTQKALFLARRLHLFILCVGVVVVSVLTFRVRNVLGVRSRSSDGNAGACCVGSILGLNGDSCITFHGDCNHVINCVFGEWTVVSHGVASTRFWVKCCSNEKSLNQAKSQLCRTCQMRLL